MGPTFAWTPYYHGTELLSIPGMFRALLFTSWILHMLFPISGVLSTLLHLAISKSTCRFQPRCHFFQEGFPDHPLQLVCYVALLCFLSNCCLPYQIPYCPLTVIVCLFACLSSPACKLHEGWDHVCPSGSHLYPYH